MEKAWMEIRSWTRIKGDDENESEEGDVGRHDGKFKLL
jgi:hypothetical protein